MNKDQLVLNHYKRIARNYGLRADSTLRDSFIRSVEIDFVIGTILDFISKFQRFPKLLDAGCGNGYLLSCLRECFPEMELAGFEYSPELLELAQSRDISNCHIFYHDIREEFPEGDFDMIITKRVIVNLHSRKQQLNAFKNIYQALKTEGQYILIESFQANLDELNVMIQENGQEKIYPSDHNFYLKAGVWFKMIKLGFEQLEGVFSENYLSTYFVLTRVFHPMIRSKGEKRLNNRLVKFFTQGLEPDTGEFSPIKFQVLKKNN